MYAHIRAKTYVLHTYPYTHSNTHPYTCIDTHTYVHTQVVMVFISVIGVITYRVIMSVNYCGNPTECMIVTTLVSSVLNAASIMLLGKVYEHLAAILTNWG